MTEQEATKEIGVFLVPVEFVPVEWTPVYHLLNPAVEHSGGRWSMAALLRSLCMGEYQLWIVRRGEYLLAVAVTNVVTYPHRTLLSVQFLGGSEFEDWNEPLLRTLEGFARSTGCHGVEAVGRFGFWPFFKKQGYGRSYCTYDKLLEDQ